MIVALLNAVARAGTVAWRYYQFKDETEQLVRFGAGVSMNELQERIYEKGLELSVPVERQDIDVRRDGDLTVTDVFYADSVEYFPRFTYPVDLAFSVETRAIKMPRTADFKR